MKPSLILLSSLVAAVAVSACGIDHSSTVLGPSKVVTPTAATTAATTSSTPSYLGTWVMANNASTNAITASSVTTKAITSLPDFSSCTNFQWSITNQTATQMSGNFSAECPGGMTFAGTITGQMTQVPIPIVLSGSMVHGADSCAFSLSGSALPVSSTLFHITYSGTTCLGPMQGANDLSLAPHSAPTSFALSGTLTDGTSGGILPGIEVATSGMAVRTDSSGNYRLTGVPAGAVTVNFAAASYITQTQTVTLGGDTVLNVVLQRVAPPAPAPAPSQPSSNGDQIDMHSVIVRGPAGDVASWPVTTNIRVIDFNSSGAFVDFDAKSRWPEVIPPGWDGGIQYTLWIVEKINGQWITSGGVEYWRGLQRQGGAPSRLASNWYYSPAVWGELASHQPAPGEQVGFFVTAGDQRAKDVRAVTERSNVVLVPFPSDGGGYYPF